MQSKNFRFKLLLTVFLSLISLLTMAKEPTVASSSKPNVLFVICDDLNTHVSPSGYKHIYTPSLESLAKNGMTLRRAYCQYPVCGPSRASMLSGLYPESSGIISNTTDIREIRPNTMSLPQLFKESGYWTGATGKVFHNAKTDPGDVAWNEVHFFENEEMPMVTPIRETFEKENGKIESSKKVARKWRKLYPTIAPQTAGQKPGYGPTGLKDEQHKDGKNAGMVMSWLQKKPFATKPFFMALGLHKPHGPYLAPDKYFDMYPTNKLVVDPVSKNFWKQAPKIAQTKRYKGFDFEFGVENDPLRRKYIQAYHSCISFMDAQLGKVIEALKSEGYWDDTIIVFVGDNGYLLGEKYMWGKVFLWDLCANVPMIMRVPGMTEPGTVSESIVELVDLFPTLTELCKLEAPKEIQGKSLTPVLKDHKAKVRDSAYTVVVRGKKAGTLGRTVHTERWHYICWPEGKGEELYDLKNDPKELKNLAKSPEHKVVLRKMQNQLADSTKMAEAKKRP